MQDNNKCSQCDSTNNVTKCVAYEHYEGTFIRYRHENVHYASNEWKLLDHALICETCFCIPFFSDKCHHCGSATPDQFDSIKCSSCGTHTFDPTDKQERCLKCNAIEYYCVCTCQVCCTNVFNQRLCDAHTKEIPFETWYIFKCPFCLVTKECVSCKCGAKIVTNDDETVVLKAGNIVKRN